METLVLAYVVNVNEDNVANYNHQPVNLVKSYSLFELHDE